MKAKPELKIFVVGCHEPKWPEGLDFEPNVVGQENVTFPADYDSDDLTYLFGWAVEAGADAVIFQAFPTQLVDALISYALRAWADAASTNPWYPLAWVGGIVNEPRPDLRESPTVKEIEFSSQKDAFVAADAISAANPRANVSVIDGATLRLEVDAPMPFRPVRIIWL